MGKSKERQQVLKCPILITVCPIPAYNPIQCTFCVVECLLGHIPMCPVGSHSFVEIFRKCSDFFTLPQTLEPYNGVS